MFREVYTIPDRTRHTQSYRTGSRTDQTHSYIHGQKPNFLKIVISFNTNIDSPKKLFVYILYSDFIKDIYL